jgi:hypothetical protein
MENDAADTPVGDLERLASGLYYPSETDAPFEPLSWDTAALGEPTADSARVAAGAAADAPVHTRSIDQLLGPLGLDRPAFDDDERAVAARFRDLAAALNAALAEPRVYRVGSPEVTILIVGRAADGRWHGLRTAAVET